MTGRKYIAFVCLVCFLAGMVSCQEKDDVPPVLTLIGNADHEHILNQPYVDAGAKAVDQIDGDISTSIHMISDVNENLLGHYTVTYRVTDEAGNAAEPISRLVRVINTSWGYMANYYVTESQVFPNIASCNYVTWVGVDTTVNNRIIFYNFACDSTGLAVHADVSDTSIYIPHQSWFDSIGYFSLEGSGNINDTSIHLLYMKKSDSDTTFWSSSFSRL